MSFIEPHFKRLLWLLQCEERDSRYKAFAVVKYELGEALKALPFDYMQMMHLARALYLLLYKEDRLYMQDSITREIAQLIHQCPDLAQMQAILGVEEEENFESEEEDYFVEGVENNPQDGDKQRSTSGLPDAVEEAYEAEEEAQEPQRDELYQISEYAGYQTLYFRCMLETFCREFDRVDYLRQNKFLLLIRRVLEEALVCGFDNQSIDQIKYLAYTLQMVCLDKGRVLSMQCPRSLGYHIIDVYTDCLHFACKNSPPAPDYFSVAVSFWGEVLIGFDGEPEIQEAILQKVFDDFTELSFYGDEAFANYIEPESQGSDHVTLSDCFWILALRSKEHKNDLEAFAQQIEEFVDWWKSDESAKYKENRPRGLKQQEKEYKNYLKVIYDETVRVAKQQRGEDWEKYVDKSKDEWEYDAKLPEKAMRIENLYLPGYEKKADDL